MTDREYLELAAKACGMTLQEALQKLGMPINLKRIAWELERTALGDGFYGNALRVAKDIPGITSEDRSVLDRYATGTQTCTDHVHLQWLAQRLYNKDERAPEAPQLKAEQPAEQQPQEPVAWPHVWGCRANAFCECDKGCTAPQRAAVPAEDAIEAAYWDFDARHKGYGPHKTMPQSERERIRLAEVARLEQAAAVVEPADSPMPDVEPAEQVQSERMSLRRINHLLAPLGLSHQTLADLGFYPTYPPGATLAWHPNYSASDFPKICQTISDLAAAAAWGSQETAEREAYEAAQRKEDAK